MYHCASTRFERQFDRWMLPGDSPYWHIRSGEEMSENCRAELESAKDGQPPQP